MYKSQYKHKREDTRLRMFILLVFLTVFSNLGITQEYTAYNTKGKVQLATGEGYWPFVDSELPAGGWSTSLIKQTFDKLNLNAQIEILPWNRALKWTNDGKILAAFPFVYSAQRAEQFLFSTPINFVSVHMYVSGNSTFTSPEQLKNKRLCFPFSYSLDSLEQGIVDKYHMSINRAKDGIGCIKHVQKGWSDAGLTNGYIQADKLPKDDINEIAIVIFPEQLALIPLHLVIGKNYPNAEQWLIEFNYAFNLLLKSGEKAATDKQFLDLINVP